MAEVLFAIAVILLLTILALLIALLRKLPKAGDAGLLARIDAFEKAQERAERAVREEIADSRSESGKASSQQRQELMEVFKNLGDSLVDRLTDAAAAMRGQLDGFSTQLGSFAKASGERLDGIRVESAAGARQVREEVVSTLHALSVTVTDTMSGMAAAQRNQLDAMSAAITKLSESNEKKLDAVRTTVEGKLESIQLDNAKQLEQMRQTVDEKLQGTLERRLGESFRQVSERLEQVHKGLGEMQTLATGVGDLKRVLTNVKTRGTWGEVQLGAMLEQILNPDQFSRNVATKDGGERVEFTINLPGQGSDRDEIVWLPIDAKFPIEDYQRLIEAQETGDVAGAEAAAKQLDIRVRGCAKDICEKYLNPPKTTDFGVLFLPIEGLFAEVIRRAGLTEVIQRECHVIVAGPTTL